MTKQRIINNPDEWIITRKGDFIRIKDELKFVEKKLETIREHLKKPFSGKVRFSGKTGEQISKERYDKVWEENNFDLEKIHAWLYDEKNKDKVEIVKLEGQDFSEAVEAIFNYVKSSKQKWRIRWGVWQDENRGRERKALINEETGQIIYHSSLTKEKISDLVWEEYNGDKTPILIKTEKERVKKWEKGKYVYNSVVIFLHGTYGATNQFPELEKNFPNTKFIYPNSPTLQYDMWHGSDKAPGGQCQGWINITGDAWELMDSDLPKSYNNPHNPPSKKNFAEADKIIHLDYHQLMRAVNYVNEIIEQEINAGIPSEKIFVSGYSQGGLLTLAVALTSQHKLGGFISLCGLLPRWDKLLVNPSDKNKKTPCLIINNSGDSWVPFWTGKKSYDLLKERDYNVEFKTRPGRGHGWENEDIINFLEKVLAGNYENPQTQNNDITKNNQKNNPQKILISVIVIAGVIAVIIIIVKLIKRKKTCRFR
ncbi:MAG: hypothetical protein I3274_04455 [Candidatus Moeniiplasma glomeromycotorum]|nr:hypothetical protein [Candidatus Moeniiplasma glomeromycotorum]